jgi:hypothetical protein
LGAALPSLAELEDRAAALGAGAGRGVEDPLARQVLGQGSACRLAGAIPSCRPIGRRGSALGRDLCLSRGLLELAQLQLELGDDPRPTLGRLAELLAPGSGEEQLQALDLQPRAGDLDLGRESCGTLGQDHGVRSGEVVGRKASKFCTTEVKQSGPPDRPCP